MLIDPKQPHSFLSIVLVLLLSLAPPLTFSQQVPNDIMRIMQKEGRGEQLTTAEEKRLNDWLDSQKRKTSAANANQQMYFWSMNPTGRLSYKCTYTDQHSVEEEWKHFNISFATIGNPIDPSWHANMAEMMRFNPGPLGYVATKVEGNATIIAQMRSDDQSSNTECSGRFTDAPNSATVFLGSPVPEPVPLVKSSDSAAQKKRTPRTRTNTGIFEGYGDIALSIAYKCTRNIRTFDPPRAYSESDQYTLELNLPIHVTVTGNTVTAKLIRCNDEEKMKKELRMRDPAFSEVTPNCFLFPNPEIPCVISGELTGHLTQGKAKP